MSQPKIPKKATCAKEEPVKLPEVFRCFSSNLDLDKTLHVMNSKTKRLWTAGIRYFKYITSNILKTLSHLSVDRQPNMHNVEVGRKISGNDFLLLK